MDRALSILAAIERTIIAVAAVAALFPLYQWYGERDARARERLVNVAALADSCLKFYEGELPDLGAVDVYEHICSVAVEEITSWETEVYAAPIDER